ncbi:MAG TPA: VOC family protein [Chloroflexota bacterium]|nr:VOC family protein [Chloroflexota bacterium]
MPGSPPAPEGGESACYLPFADEDGRIRAASDRRRAVARPSLSLRFPARHPLTLARFWAPLLACVVEGGDAEFASVVDPSGALPRLLFVCENQPGTGIELEVGVDDLDAAIERCQALGARLIEQEEGGARLIDPEGTPFSLRV